MGKIKELSKKLDDGLLHARADVPYLYTSPDSPLKCNSCHAHLGLWRMVRRALFKKQGDVYFVRCKKCGGTNRRIKGETGQQLDERWTETK